MGQAKLRGTREERIANAEIRAYDMEMKRERERSERWANMTPEERKAAMKSAQLMMMMIGGMK